MAMSKVSTDLVKVKPGHEHERSGRVTERVHSGFWLSNHLESCVQTVAYALAVKWASPRVQEDQVHFVVQFARLLTRSFCQDRLQRMSDNRHRASALLHFKGLEHELRADYIATDLSLSPSLCDDHAVSFRLPNCCASGKLFEQVSDVVVPLFSMDVPRLLKFANQDFGLGQL